MGDDSELNSSQTLLEVFKRLPVHLQRKFSDKVMLIRLATQRHLHSYCLSLKTLQIVRIHFLAKPCHNQRDIKLKSGQVFSAQSKAVDEKHCQKNPRDVCPSCNFNNHTLSSSIEPNPPPSAESTTTDASVTVSVHNYKVRLMVLPVRVYDEDLNKFVDTYGFLDSGSEMSFCTTSLRKLQLQGKEVTKNIVGLSGSRLHRGSMVSFSMKGLESNVISIRNVFAIDALPKLAESIPSNNDIERYEHLRGLHFPEVHSKDVEVLVGAAVLEAHEITESRYGKDAQPEAIRTGLGWTLVGPEPCLSGKK